MTEEQESGKKVNGGPWITAGDNVSISGVRGQLASGKRDFGILQRLWLRY